MLDLAGLAWARLRSGSLFKLSWTGVAGLGWSGLGCVGLGWLGCAGLGWPGLGWPGLGWSGLVRARLVRAGVAGLGCSGLGCWAGLAGLCCAPPGTGVPGSMFVARSGPRPSGGPEGRIETH